jgi:hypothetical protein
VHKKRLILWVVIISGAVIAAVWAPRAPVEAPLAASNERTPASSVQPTPSTGRFSQLPARDLIGRAPGELFPAQSPKPAAPSAAAKAVPPPPPAPVAPPMPYRVAGKVAHEGGTHVVLAKGDRVLLVHVGDTLEDGYRVESIGAQDVVLTYLPLNLRQHLPVTVALDLDAGAAQAAQTRATVPSPASSPAAAGATAARLRLEGPAQIRAGDAFSVALKVSSQEAVRSAPLQLSFDAELLEAVDVRRGGFFADGSFSYRINPSGSIFIGASGKGAVPADAEFFVVTFKPVRAGAAELKLSSVLLQGAAGRAIAHDQPLSLRTSIVQ